MATLKSLDWENAMGKKIDDEYAALKLIEILYEKGLVNKSTFEDVQKQYKTDSLHISQAA